MQNDDNHGKGAIPQVSIKGVVDEEADLEGLFKAVQGTVSSVIVDCGGISRINSAGVRSWRRVFGALAKRGVKCSFRRCPSGLVEQLNTYDGFLCGGEVLSILVPMMCRKCGTAADEEVTPEQVVANGFEVKSVRCASCGGESDFDDFPDFYFGFLRG